MDDDELDLLRDEQDATVAELAYAYRSIAELVAAGVDVEPLHDPGGEHELSCRLIADEVFEEHRDHLDAVGTTRVLDQVATVAAKLTGSPEAQAVATSLRETTVPALRGRVYAPDDEDGTREQELRDAAALVLAANALQRAALDR
ncbi:MAG: hypothetical protein JWO77_1962 [Ilumatobacteraceae bacterium]|nr:hypothetical protein [Ilumatobacteraceae bacterium]